MGTLTALDLSLTATGLFHGDPEDPHGRFMLAEIAPPDRRKDEGDIAWNARRFDFFSGQVLAHLDQYRPELLVLEVTSHAHTSYSRDGQTRDTSRGQEFKAGLGLGRSLGWIDGVMVLASAYGYAPARVETIEANDVKLRIAGNRTASKLAVKNKLLELFGWRTDDWKESQTDALAAGLAYLRQAEMLAAERKIRSIAAERAVRRPRRRAIRDVDGRLRPIPENPADRLPDDYPPRAPSP